MSTNPDNIHSQATHLLQQAGLDANITSIQPCTRGGNNRTFRLETASKTYALKEYFRQEGDIRDRLQSEYAFLAYANKVAPSETPLAYTKHDDTGMALYEFIDGKPLQPGEVAVHDVEQAAQFFCHLNSTSALAKARNIPVASEACFSIDDHLELIGKRVSKLTELEEDQYAAEFIVQLNQRWQKVKDIVLKNAADAGINLSEQLAQQDRCISPSDFGFHNALKQADGRLVFIDFEYAGWDDPAKMVGDFFSQLAVPVPATLFDTFTSTVMQPFNDVAKMRTRATLLRSVYEIKWCCIALNIFIPVHLARRQFANPNLNVVELKKNQLAKAQALIKRMEVA